jgi:adenylyl-sulfate kinase
MKADPKTARISSTITREDRKKKWGHHGAVIWFTGLSGSGKSTLALGLESKLQSQGMATCILDGDTLRKGLCADLGFSPKDRKENIRRTGEVAKLFAEAGFIVICALISPYRDDREKVRYSCLQDHISFIEVFIDASLDICEQRDPRGLYARARAGMIVDFTGIDSPYEVPEHPDLHLPTHQYSTLETLEELHHFVQKWIYS